MQKKKEYCILLIHQSKLIHNSPFLPKSGLRVLLIYWLSIWHFPSFNSKMTKPNNGEAVTACLTPMFAQPSWQLSKTCLSHPLSPEDILFNWNVIFMVQEMSQQDIDSDHLWQQLQINPGAQELHKLIVPTSLLLTSVAGINLMNGQSVK